MSAAATVTAIMADPRPVNYADVKWYQNTKARPEALMKMDLNPLETRSYFALEVFTMGWGFQLAVVNLGKAGPRRKPGTAEFEFEGWIYRAATLAEVRNRAGLDERSWRAGLSGLEGRGLAKRQQLPDGTWVVYSWAEPKAEAAAPLHLLSRRLHPSWESLLSKTASTYLKANKIKELYNPAEEFAEVARQRVMELVEEVARRQAEEDKWVRDKLAEIVATPLTNNEGQTLQTLQTLESGSAQPSPSPINQSEGAGRQAGSVTEEENRQPASQPPQADRIEDAEELLTMVQDRLYSPFEVDQVTGALTREHPEIPQGLAVDKVREKLANHPKIKWPHSWLKKIILEDCRPLVQKYLDRAAAAGSDPNPSPPMTEDEAEAIVTNPKSTGPEIERAKKVLDAWTESKLKEEASQ